MRLCDQPVRFFTDHMWMILVVAVIGLTTQAAGLEFRLFGGGQNDGLLQIRKSGWSEYVVVCSKTWAFTRKEADVLCRGLGKDSGNSVITKYAKYWTGNETFLELKAVAIDFKCNGTEGSFVNCVDENKIGSPRNETCHGGIGVLCTRIAPAYRIVDNQSLEVSIDSTWSSVCADRFTVDDAVVACRSMGKPWTDARPLRIVNPDSRGWKLRDLRCTGSEESFMDCSSLVWGDTGCDTGRDAGISCGEAVDFKFRLMNGSALSAGRLELRYKDRWGTVCSRDGSFTRSSARVICKSLKLQYKSARVVSVDEFGVGNGVIWMDGVSCSGGESNLLQCNPQFDGNPITLPCSHQYDVGVSCEGYKLDGQGNAGNLLVSYQGRWIDIYNNTFDVKAATVACRALDLPRSGVRFLSVDLAHPKAEVLGVSSCKGFEETLFDCDYEWKQPEELVAENITVGRIQLRCEHADSTRIRFRHPGDDSVGLYEVYNGTHWGTICGNGLGENVAQVACRNQGFGSSFAAVLPTSYTTKGNGSVLMDGVSCQGTEDSLARCNYNPLGVISCDTDHRDDLNIYCGKIEDNFGVRLADGNSKAGRVEVKIFGSWGTVCPDGFDNNAAKVVCRQLKLPILEPRTVSQFASGTGRIWLQEVNCTGEEESIRDCKYGAFIGERHCTHEDDIGVVCSGTVVDPGSNLSGGAIAGVVIAILIIFAIVIVALCFGIRKWSAARRDLGNNLLKTPGSRASKDGGNRGVQYNHDDGVVNMGFNDSPNSSRNREEEAKEYGRSSRPYGGDQYADYDTDEGHLYQDELRPPAYHTLDLNEGPRNPTNYGVRPPSSEKYYPGSNGPPRSPHDHGLDYRASHPEGRSPRTPHSQEQGGQFGFNDSPRNQEPYSGGKAGYPRASQPPGKIVGRQAAPPQYTPSRGYDNDSMASPSYKDPRYDNQYAPRPQASPTRLPSSSSSGPRDPSPVYDSRDIPEGTSV